MSNRVEYDRLHTIDDVRRERRRIGKEIRRNDAYLRDDAERLSELCSVDYWSDILSVKAAGLIERITSGAASRIRSFSSIFSALNGLTNNLFGRFSRSSRPGRRKRRPYERYDFRDKPFEDAFDDEIDERIDDEIEERIEEDFYDEQEDRVAEPCDPCRGR